MYQSMSLPIAEINPERNYWLIRTEAGEYYNEFYHDKFIGMGWDELNHLKEEEYYNDEFMKELVAKHYDEEVKQPWRVYTQIRKFIFEIKSGDIVLIPSPTHISFGIVQGEVYYHEVSESEINQGLCPYKKRRRISWLKTVRRSDLDPYLYKLLNSHFTISNANEYSPYIDRTLHSFYVKGDRAHLVLNVTTEDHIFVRDLMRVINGTIDLVDTFNEINETELDSNDIELRLNVQSPGPIEFIGNLWTITAIGVVLVFVVGGKFSLKHTKEKTEVTAQSEGLIEKALKVMQHLSERKEKHQQLVDKRYEEALRKLQVEIPEELKSLPDKQEDINK